jgi:hypothetical protein
MGQTEARLWYLEEIEMDETGLGRDESRKNIVMPEAWWKKIAKVSGIIAEVVSFFDLLHLLCVCYT